MPHVLQPPIAQLDTAFFVRNKSSKENVITVRTVFVHTNDNETASRSECHFCIDRAHPFSSNLFRTTRFEQEN